MAPTFCCGFRKAPSPEPEPVHLVDTSQTSRGRFALSSHDVSPTSSRADVWPNQEIFDPASRDEGDIVTPTVSARDLPSRREIDSGVQRRSSSRRLHDVARKVRKSMSRDSGMSKRSLKHGLRSSISKEDMDRRDELKRVLHDRVRTDVREDDDTIYDEDAVPIKTPVATVGRHEGLIQISPKHLSNAMRRSHSPSASMHREVHQRDQSGPVTGTDTTAALTRMLTRRVSHMTGSPEDQAGSAKYIVPERTKTTKKYIFDDEDTPRKEYQSRSPSPLGRSKTVIRITPSFKPAIGDLPKSHAAESPPSPDFLPLHSACISDPLAGGDWRLSIPERRGDSLPVPLTDFMKRPAVSTILSGIYDTRIRPASEQWLHGASGLLSTSIHQKHLPEKHSPGKTTIHHEHHCDPSSEEMDFGGIDGEDDSPPYSAFRTARSSNEDNQPHIYNVHVPKRLASNSLLASLSLPQLQDNNRQRSYNKGDSSDFSVKPGDQATSPRIMPMAWDNTHRPRESSSVYSSQPESLYSSGRNSLVQGTTLADRFQQHETRNASSGIISVPASRPSIDLDKLERQTMSTSFHSSNESLTMRELASAEARIQPISRAMTVPKNSRFREDLGSISDEIARTNPPRCRASNLDGSADNRHFSSLSPGYIEATSIWEKALREHSHEDALLNHTRLGSTSPKTSLDLDEGPLSDRRVSSRPPLERSGKSHAVESWQGRSLQARLAEYKLPSPSPPPPTPLAPIESRGRRPTVGNDQRTVSTGSWTRFPSHTRLERGNSPAGEGDQVFARDFADMTPGTPEKSASLRNSKLGVSKAKARSTNFTKDIIGSLKHIYRTQSQELQRRLQNEARGHRSSISEGGVLEYPELEILGSISPPMPSPDIKTKKELDKLLRGGSPLKRSDDVDGASEPVVGEGTGGVGGWLEHYRDCVRVPLDSEVVSRVTSRAGEGNGDPGSKGGRCGLDGAGSGSYELRASTINFKRSLELDEEKARARVLAFGDGGGEGLGV